MYDFLSVLWCLLVGGAVLAAILIARNKSSKLQKTIVWIIFTVVMAIMLVFGRYIGIVQEKADNQLYEYNTLDESIEEWMPNNKVANILYYEDHAILFFEASTNNEGEDEISIRVAKKTNGMWSKLNQIRSIRTKITPGGGLMNICTLDRECEMDFICIQDGNKNIFDEDGSLKENYRDSLGTEFRTSTIYRGEPIVYAFADIDQEGYSLYIDDKEFLVADINFGILSPLDLEESYNYRKH